MRLIRITGLLWVLWVSNLEAQTSIKVMAYNLLHFPSTLVYDADSGNYISREGVLSDIFHSYEPDIFMVCELESLDGAEIVLNAIQTEDDRYNKANFIYNQSSSNTGLQQMIFYNEQKLSLESQEQVQTYLRDINHYTFRLSSTDIYLEVFVAHLKASSGYDNEQSRYSMALDLTQYLESMNPESYVIVGGDFNVYNSSEPAYQELLDETNNIVLKDPINAPGYWSNNDDFSYLHTQSTLTNNSHLIRPGGSSDGATGGLDDRFDFLLVSDNMLNVGELYYVESSYNAYGNNANCFNDNINDSGCAGSYSQNLRDSLYKMSDHLPVVMELFTPENLSVSEEITTPWIEINGTNVVNNTLSLQVSDEYKSEAIWIYNMLGQKVSEKYIHSGVNDIDVNTYESGVYFVLPKVQFETTIPIKFIKK
jgi:exonuclease III